MNKRSLHMKILTASSVLMIAFFQNCSGGFTADMGEGSFGSEGDFFNYPYASAPTFYKGVQFFITDGVSPGSPLGQFTIVATSVFVASPTAPITYDVTVKTPDGQTVCAEQAGSLASGSTKVQFSCTAMVPATQVVVVFTTTANGLSDTSTSVFP